MLTYELKKTSGVPLYEALYRCIRGDILSGALRPGEKLPSKRALAENLEVSKITVEAAYSQLLSEGYICSKEKVGYFVETVERRAPVPAAPGRSLPSRPDRQRHGAVSLFRLVALAAGGHAGLRRGASRAPAQPGHPGAAAGHCRPSGGLSGHAGGSGEHPDRRGNGLFLRFR